MKYIYSTSQISKLSLKLHTFSITDSVAGLFLISLIIVILSTLETCMAWFIPRLIKNSSASVKVTLNAWWIILARILEWMCYNKVAMLFLILTSEMTTVF